MGAAPPPRGLPGSGDEAKGADEATDEPVRNDAPAPRALTMQSANGEADAPAPAPAPAAAKPGSAMSHADLREMLRRNVAALRAMLDDNPGEG